jgi:hypothetical protein
MHVLRTWATHSEEEGREGKKIFRGSLSVAKKKLDPIRLAKPDGMTTKGQPPAKNSDVCRSQTQA